MIEDKCSVMYEVGPDSLEIKLPKRWLLALRGVSVEVTEDEALLLLAMPGWCSILEATDDPEGDAI